MTRAPVRILALSVLAVAGYAFVGALAGLQLRDGTNTEILWMPGAVVSMVALLVLRFTDTPHRSRARWWFAVGGSSILVGLVGLFAVPDLAALAGALVGAGIAVVFVRLTIARRGDA